MIFAESTFREEHKPVGLSESDRLKHTYILGKTGMGKSTLIARMISQDIFAGRGVALLDPHGDLLQQVASLIPPQREKDVYLFDFPDHIFNYNPIRHLTSPEERYLVATELVGAFQRIWHESWGPRMENLFRFSLIALASIPNTTMNDIRSWLLDPDARERGLKLIDDPLVLDYWRREFRAFGKDFQAEMTQPVLNKVDSVLASPIIQRVMCNRKHSINLRKAMDERKIVLMNLSKGRMGVTGSHLLGALTMTGFMSAALSRFNVAEASRVTFYLYADEAHSFTTLSVADILQEARKYKLGLILAHQFIEQMQEEVQAALLANVGLFICFRLGARDAHTLEGEFSPEFSATDLTRIAPYEAVVKITSPTVSPKPFSVRTLLP